MSIQKAIKIPPPRKKKKKKKRSYLTFLVFHTSIPTTGSDWDNDLLQCNENLSTPPNSLQKKSTETSHVIRGFFDLAYLFSFSVQAINLINSNTLKGPEDSHLFVAKQMEQSSHSACSNSRWQRTKEEGDGFNTFKAHWLLFSAYPIYCCWCVRGSVLL